MELCEEDLSWAKETIKKTELFTSCVDAELNELLNGLEKKHYAAGATIIFQGEISNRLYLIEKGLVQVVVRKGKMKNKVAELGPNRYFGEISLLTPRAATATIICAAETDIISLPGEVVQNLLKKNSSLADAINKEIEERLESNRKKEEGEEEYS